MKFRFANHDDAGPFTKWACENKDIPLRDIDSARKENNPTATVLVIETDEGVPILYAPGYCALMIAYLGFNPEATERQKIEAMSKMLEALKAFSANFGINEIEVLSRPEYSVAKWAIKHGFKQDERQLFTAKVLEGGLPCAPAEIQL
jgi:hypothetical protein